jgi:DinB family protein
VKKRDDLQDLAVMRSRLAAARARLEKLPLASHLDAGPTDPATGESWHRGNVLGHMSEMTDYWIVQLRNAAAGSKEVGRNEEGYKSRRHGIDHGNAATEAELKVAVDGGIGRVIDLLDTFSAADLDREVVYHTRDGDRDARLGELLEMLLVEHVEEHVSQLASLS